MTRFHPVIKLVNWDLANRLPLFVILSEALPESKTAAAAACKRATARRAALSESQSSHFNLQ